jgi:hypothetical protein
MKIKGEGCRILQRVHNFLKIGEMLQVGRNQSENDLGIVRVGVTKAVVRPTAMGLWSASHYTYYYIDL